MTAAPTPEERRRIFAGCCEHSDLWHDGHGCVCCDCKVPRRRELTIHAEPDPVIEVGTPVLGETTENEPITWYVTHVAEDGTVTIGAEKPPT